MTAAAKDQQRKDAKMIATAKRLLRENARQRIEHTEWSTGFEDALRMLLLEGAAITAGYVSATYAFDDEGDLPADD